MVLCLSPIPDTDHVSRLCSEKQITDKGRVSGAAFQLRKLDQGLLSVNWNENLNLASRDLEIEALSKIYTKVKSIPVVGRSISILNVGNTKNHVHKNSEDKRWLEFLHNPSKDDKSHAGIKNVIIDETIVPELIAESVIERFVIS